VQQDCVAEINVLPNLDFFKGTMKHFQTDRNLKAVMQVFIEQSFMKNSRVWSSHNL
jgi:hypothetical protein